MYQVLPFPTLTIFLLHEKMPHYSKMCYMVMSKTSYFRWQKFQTYACKFNFLRMSHRQVRYSWLLYFLLCFEIIITSFYLSFPHSEFSHVTDLILFQLYMKVTINAKGINCWHCFWDIYTFQNNLCATYFSRFYFEGALINHLHYVKIHIVSNSLWGKVSLNYDLSPWLLGICLGLNVIENMFTEKNGLNWRSS